MRSCKGHLLIFVGLFAFGAVAWAYCADPYRRSWGCLWQQEPIDGPSVSVLPKFGKPEGMVIYISSNIAANGKLLLQFAEVGFATLGVLNTNHPNPIVKVEPTNENVKLYHHFITNILIARLVCGHEAPGLLIVCSNQSIESPRFVVLIPPYSDPNVLTANVNSMRGEVFVLRAVQDLKGKDWTGLLQRKGVAVSEKLISNPKETFGSDRDLIIRLLAEFCKAKLFPNEPFSGVPKRKVAPFWVWELPAVAWAGFCFYRWRRRVKKARMEDAGWRMAVAEPLKGWEIGLRVVAWVLAFMALAETGVHLVTPQLATGEKTLAVARRWLVAPKMAEEFKLMAADGVWQGRPLKWLLDNVELSHYNRNELMNWKIDKAVYRDFVLSPVIESAGEGKAHEYVRPTLADGKAGGDTLPTPAISDGELNWRRPLWESFYPRVRKENSPEAVAPIVVRFLRERVTMSRDYHPTGGIVTAWERGITDAAGFERIYVAALRSVGVGARLDGAGRAELWTGKAWITAPRPIAETFL